MKISFSFIFLFLLIGRLSSFVLNKGIRTFKFGIINHLCTLRSANNPTQNDFQIGHYYQNIILFDGVCNFCNAWVDFIGKLDRKNIITFCALQSKKGQELLQLIGKSNTDISSVVFIRELKINRSIEKGLDVSEVYFKSDAALKVLESLTFNSLPYNPVKMGFYIPKFVRDSLYDTVAANRYNIL
eukprot:gene13864-18593_t